MTKYTAGADVAEKEEESTVTEVFGKHCSGSVHSFSSRSGALNQETELSLTNDYHGLVLRAICVMVGASVRSAFRYKNRQLTTA